MTESDEATDGYRRRVASGEKTMVALNELRPPFVIQLVLEGEGEPEPQVLYDALQATTAANPGSALRLQESDDGDYWVAGPAPTFTVVDEPTFAASGRHDAPFLRWRLSATTGPTCELVYVRGRDRNHLVFRALHAVMDGQGTLAWAKDFMRCLRGEAPVGHPSTLDVHQLYEGAVDDLRPLPNHDALHPLGLAGDRATGRYGWRRIKVDRPLSAEATGRMALAIRALALRHHDTDGVIRLHLPTDLRPYIPKVRSTANLFGSLFLEVDGSTDPETVGLQIVRMLYEREGLRLAGFVSFGEIGTMAAHRVKAYLDLCHQHDTGRYPFSGMLSHLGRHGADSLSGTDWRSTSAVFVPLVSDACVMSVHGFDEHTEVAVGVSDRFDTDGRLDTLANALEEALNR